MSRITTQRLRLRLARFLAIVTVTAATVQADFPFGAWGRVSNEFVVSPPEGFESAGTFNPTVMGKKDKFVVLYCAQDRKATSALGYASSDDGIHFIRRSEPVMVAETAYEKGNGVEDPPRLVKSGIRFVSRTLDVTTSPHRFTRRCTAVHDNLHRPHPREAIGHHHARL